MTVSFSLLRQEILESDEIVEVCLELSGILERSVSVLLSTLDDTAVGKSTHIISLHML